MSIASEISRLQTAKSALKTAIEGKGVTVPSAAKLDGYAALVDQISQGGGGTIEGGVVYDEFTAGGSPTHAILYPYLSGNNLLVPKYACASQTYLESADFHGNVQKIDAYAFNQCSHLALTELPESVEAIGDNTFTYCRALALTKLPAGLTSIGNSCFMQTAVTFDTVPVGVKKLYTQSFQACTGLTSMTIPGLYATNNNEAYGSVFQGCTNLKTVDMNHPYRFYTNFFSGCTSLDTLIIRQTGSIAPIYNTNAFLDTPIRAGSGTVYVPQALVGSYKTASNWSTYVSAGTQILPIEGSIYETQYANGEPVTA